MKQQQENDPIATHQLLLKHSTPSNQIREQANSTQAKKKVNAKKKVASPFK